MASVILDVGGGDIVGGDGDNDGVGSFHEVDNWLGSSSYTMQEGWQQLEAPLVQSSPAPGCFMGCSLADKKWYMNTQESCIVKDSEVQKKINDRKAQLERSRIQREADLNHFEGDTEVSEFCSDNSVHSDGSADEAIQMEIDSASGEDRPLELTTLVKYVKNPGPTSRCHNDVEHKHKPDWFPEPDEFYFAGDLGISDEEEEDEVDLPYLLKKPKRLDGCFIKLTTGQQILAATRRDGNNNIYPIAFGVVDKEDGDSWTWFLTHLRCCIGSGSKFGTYTIISDRQKGLLKAINEVFPDSPQRYCLRHIYANFQSAGFTAAELKKLVDQASYSFTKHGHELGMTLLKAECEGACEVFNKMILDVRAKPIRTMFEGTRTKQMIKRQKTRRWDMTGVTCSHAIAAMSKVHMHPEDFVHEFFRKPLYIEAYKYIVYPVPGPELWPDTQTQDIEPPLFKEKSGTKQTTRRKGQFEVPAPKDTSRMGKLHATIVVYKAIDLQTVGKL
ncbi:MATE efflux family protein 3, chloroplastic [Hordeum vulgare]|nr:MATE efflux family protein 3, chloroplastic [Hordeum vulgare]